MEKIGPLHCGELIVCMSVCLSVGRSYGGKLILMQFAMCVTHLYKLCTGHLIITIVELKSTVIIKMIPMNVLI